MSGYEALVAALAGAAVLAWPEAAGAARHGPGPRPTAGSELGAAARRAGRRSRHHPGSTSDVAAAVDLLVLALRGGGGVVEGIELVAALSSGEVATQLRSVSAALRWGIDPVQAWSAVSPLWSPAARALSLAGRAGIPPGELLARAAADLRQDEAHRLEVATTRLGVRLVLPLGLAFLPAFVLTTVAPLVLALAHQALA